MNRNSLRSRLLIREAFVQLLTEKEAKSITVTDIAQKANINRATFYAHYTCIMDVVDEMQKEVMDKMSELFRDFSFKSFFSNSTQALLEVSRFIDENREYYQILINQEGATKFLRALKDVLVGYMMKEPEIPEAVKNSPSYKLRICFFAGGIVNLYVDYLRGKLKTSIYDIPLEVAKMLEDYSIS